MARDAFPKVGEQGYDTPCISDRCYLKIHTLAGPLTGVITHKGCISLVVLVSTLFHHASIFENDESRLVTLADIYAQGDVDAAFVFCGSCSQISAP